MPSKSIGALLGLVMVAASAGCVRNRNAEALVAPTPVGSAEAPPGQPGFAVYTQTTTTIVPAAPSAHDDAGIRAEGLWLLDGDRIVRALVFPRDVAEPTPRCPDGSASRGACDEASLADVLVAETDLELASWPDRRTLVELARCECFYAQDEEPPLPSDEGEVEEDPCAGAFDPNWRPSVVSLVGGVLYTTGVVDNGGCSGAYVVDAFVSETVLARGRVAVDIDGPGACYPGVPPDLWDVAGLSEPCVPPYEGDGVPDECLPCRQGPDAIGLKLASGLLTAFGPAASYTMDGALFATSTQVSPERCPSPADPCGDPSAFLDSIEGGEYWVATDGSAALLSGNGVELFLRGEPSPVARASLSDPVLGVRFHGDVGPLVRSMASHQGSFFAPAE